MQLRRRCHAQAGIATASRHRSVRHRAAVVVAAVVGTGVVAVAPGSAQADGNVGAFLNHLNSLRAAQHLPALVMNSELTSIAQAHSQQMAAQNTIYHNPSLKTQVSNWQTLGENVGMGPTESAIDNAFDNSPGHYANEVNTSYTQVGIASVTNPDGQIFVTLDFRRPMNASSTPAATAPKPPAPKKVSSSSTGSATTTAQQTAASQAAAAQAAAQAAAAQAAAAAAASAARAAAHAAADQQAASLSEPLRKSTDPLARALVFSAQVNTMGQPG